MSTFNEAFEDLIKDMYSAEKQVLKALPKVAKAVVNPQLKQGVELHIKQTERHVTRLEEVAKNCGFKPTGKLCVAAKGLIEEVDEHIKEGEPGAVLDATIIAGAQKFEHYEISGYGTAKEWAKLMGEPECVRLLEETLREEEETDKLMTQIAESRVNRDALNAPAKPAKKAGARPMPSGKAKPSSSRGSAAKAKSPGRSKAA